jgi:predicted nuclease with TOPRIM domain
MDRVSRSKELKMSEQKLKDEIRKKKSEIISDFWEEYKQLTENLGDLTFSPQDAHAVIKTTIKMMLLSSKDKCDSFFVFRVCALAVEKAIQEIEALEE